MSHEQLQTYIKLCMSLIPQEQDSDPWQADQAYAEDASAALAYALRCRASGEAKEAASAARRVYEALDHFVTTREGLSISTPADELAALSNPIIQTELKRQQRDLEQLPSLEGADVAEQIDLLKCRAWEESKSIFGPS